MGQHKHTSLLHVIQYSSVTCILLALIAQIIVYVRMTQVTVSFLDEENKNKKLVGSCVNGLQETYHGASFHTYFAFAILLTSIHGAQELARIIKTNRQVRLTPTEQPVRAYFSGNTGFNFNAYSTFFISHVATGVFHWIAYIVLWKNHLDDQTHACYNNYVVIENYAASAAGIYTGAICLQVFHMLIYANGLDEQTAEATYPALDFKLNSLKVVSFLYGLYMAGSITYYIFMQLKPWNSCKAGGDLSVIWLCLLPLAALVVVYYIYGLSTAESGGRGAYNGSIFALIALTAVQLMVLFTGDKMGCSWYTYVEEMRDHWAGALVGGILGAILLAVEEESDGKGAYVSSSGVLLDTSGFNRTPSMQLSRLTADGPDKKVANLSFV